MLGESHRGGRRVRKKPKLDADAAAGDSDTPMKETDSTFSTPSAIAPPSHFSPQTHPQHPPPPASQLFHTRYDTRPGANYGWQQSSNNAGSESSASRHTEQINVSAANPPDAISLTTIRLQLQMTRDIVLDFNQPLVLLES